MNEILKQLANKAADMTPLMRKVAGVMESAVLENFKHMDKQIDYRLFLQMKIIINILHETVKKIVAVFNCLSC